MKVFVSDVEPLFQDSIKKFENTQGILLGDSNVKIIDFFKKFALFINEQTHSSLSPETLYKQYFIKLKSYTSPTIGYSVSYLNAFSQLVNGIDYAKKYEIETEETFVYPEFPYEPFIPCFPASELIKIEYKEYKNIWIKNEAINPTGVHKDRMAWEVYLKYESLIKESLRESGKRLKLPRLSLISSGNAALAIQYLLRLKGLPDLKVIIDRNTTDESYKKMLENSQCEVYEADLVNNKLNAQQIMEITNNTEGYDLTFGNDLNIKDTYYDWLSYEVLNANPQHMFIPYGTGDLFKNILEIWHIEHDKKMPSSRFFGNKQILSSCNFYGASTTNPSTKAKMLYAPFFQYPDNEIRNLYQNCAFVGTNTCIDQIDEGFIDEAVNVLSINGIDTDASGASGFSFFLQKKPTINPENKILIINTGKIKQELFSSRL